METGQSSNSCWAVFIPAGERRQMHAQLMLDARMVLNPVAFAVHLAAFSEHDRPLGVPAGWLWEELDRRYALLTLADLIGWLRDNLDRCMNEPLLANQPAAPTASLAMLFAARKLGLIVPVATTHSMKFFALGDWATYLSDALGSEWDEIEVTEHQGKTAWAAAVKVMSRQTGMPAEDLQDLYDRNKVFSTRQAHEYDTYERLRSLSVVTLELLAGLRSKMSISTPSPIVRNMVVHECASSEGIFIPPSDLPLQPLIERVLIQNPEAKVRDVIGIVGVRGLAFLLGGAEQLSDAITDDIVRHRLAKEISLYLLGLIPVVGNVVTAVEGAELVREVWRRTASGTSPSAESLLYFSSTACRLEP
jgi:hypothetical protein